MWQNFLTKLSELSPGRRRLLVTVGLPIWVVVAFYISQLLTVGLVWVLASLGLPFALVSEVLFNAAAMAVIYGISVVITIGLPWLLFKSRTTKEDVGLQRLPSWLDTVLAPAGFIIYAIASSLTLALLVWLLPFIDINQAQDVGFSQLTTRHEIVLGFVALVLIAPIAEEVLFRGYLFGKLKKHLPLWVAIIITSVLFGIVHGAWNVGIDTFVLGVVLCLLRVISGSLWPSILLHMIKNGIAFYLLFINPSFINSITG